MELESTEEKNNLKADCVNPEILPVSADVEPSISSPSTSGGGRNSPCVYVTYEDLIKITRECRIVLERCDQNVKASQKEEPILIQSTNKNNDGKSISQSQKEAEAAGAKSNPAKTSTSTVKLKPLRKGKKREEKFLHASASRGDAGERDNANQSRGRGRPWVNVSVLSEIDMEAIKVPDQLVRQLPSGRFQCVLCRFIFSKFSNFIYHLRNHTDERPFRCRKCLVAFKQQYQVIQHAYNRHLLAYGKDDIDFVPGRLELLARASPRKRVVGKTVGVRKTNVVSSPHVRVLPPQKDGVPKREPSKDDVELLDAMKRDENDNKIELVASREMKAFMEDLNGRYRQPQLVEMKHPDTDKIVEVEKDLLSRFIRPFLSKCGVQQNGEEDLYEMHSQLRNVLAMTKFGEISSSDLNPSGLSSTGQKRIYRRELIHSCGKCESKFSTKLQLRNHIIQNHQQCVQDRPFKCLVCEKMFKSKFNLNYHIRDVHERSGERCFKCLECESSFKHARSLRSHVLGNHDPLRSGAGNRRYNCGECGRSFMLKKNLQRHMIEHSDQNKEMLTCPKCSLFYMSDESLQAHALTHGIRPELTSSFELANNPTLKERSKLKGRKRLEKSSGESSNLETGKANGSALLSTAISQKVGKPRLKLLRCLSSGTNVAFKCTECGTFRTTEQSLLTHMRIHSCEKFYQCPKCDLQIRLKHNLKAHIEKVHGGNCEQKCGLCVAAFKTVHGLRLHEKRCHPGLSHEK